jgi:glycyl-tRNA synthetase
MASENNLEKIIALAKRRGFVYPSSEIYGGYASVYDYGPRGVELKNNLKKAWWKEMVQQRQDIVGLDSAIFMHPKTWEASGHVEGFTDPLVECKKCHHRFRSDHLEEQGKTNCPDCGGDLTEEKNFNLLVEAKLGVTDEAKSKAYLRGETCQGIYLNFQNVLNSTRQKIPFGIAQIGKAFRNEITPKNFIFRTREFEQMEMQFFIPPDKKEADKYFKYWKEQRLNWYLGLGIDKKNLRFREHKDDERAHYALAAEDIEYNTPFGGFKELEGVHNRGGWDISRHSKYSGKDLGYLESDGTRITPWIIETSAGADRAFLMFLLDSYKEDKEKNRVYLSLHKSLVPVQVAVFPLLGNKPELTSKARQVFDDLVKKGFIVEWDDRGNIGKRYFSQDEIGTPYCVTIDFDTLEKGTVTVRDRDTATQEKVNLDKLVKYLKK